MPQRPSEHRTRTGLDRRHAIASLGSGYLVYDVLKEYRMIHRASVLSAPPRAGLGMLRVSACSIMCAQTHYVNIVERLLSSKRAAGLLQHGLELALLLQR